MKLLLISLAGIGDTLAATPLVHELRANFPEARLEMFVFWPGSRDLLEGNPHLNAVHQKNLLRDGYYPSLRYLLRLRRQRFDVTINTHPQSKIQYRLVAWLIHAPLRLSHLYDNATRLDRLLVNRTIPLDYSIHTIENNLRLLELLGKKPLLAEHDFELFLTPAETAWANQFVVDRGLASKRLLGIHVGSGRTKNLALRRWPIENYRDLIRKILAAHSDWRVLLFGGPEEKEENEFLTREIQNPGLLLARTNTLRQAAALLGHCESFVSVDTALMHFAAAMKVPKQILIESPTCAPTIEPYRRPYLLVPNPAVHGRSLEFYRYDGKGIRGSEHMLREAMRAVTAESVYQTFVRAAEKS